MAVSSSSAIVYRKSNRFVSRYGRGTKPDWQRAGEVYAKANLGQAYFNLGYMHQYGAGLPQVDLVMLLYSWHLVLLSF